MILLPASWFLAYHVVIDGSPGGFYAGVLSLFYGVLLVVPVYFLLRLDSKHFENRRIIDAWLSAGYITTGVVILIMVVVSFALGRASTNADKERTELNLNATLDAMQVHGDRFWDAIGPGVVTGYEPSVFLGYGLERHPLKIGIPGTATSDLSASEEQIAANKEGTINFAKALQMEGLMDSFITVWSYLYKPDKKTVHAPECLILTGKNLFIITVKNYSQGNILWTDRDGYLVAINRGNGQAISTPEPLSFNIQEYTHLFADWFKKNNLDLRVKPRVVFMPTEQGMGTVDAVWPGKAKGVTLPDLIAELKDEPAVDFSVWLPQAFFEVCHEEDNDPATRLLKAKELLEQAKNS